MLYIKYLICICLLISIFSCSNHRNGVPDCTSNIENFLINAKNMDLSILRGLTLESRGIDINQDRKVRVIQFGNENKERFILPSLQPTKNNLNPDLEGFDYKLFANEIGINENQDSVKQFISEVVNLFLKIDIYKIHSQLNLGEFIEFLISPSCSIWYKEEEAYLSDTYSQLFSKGIEIQKNWYILPSYNSADSELSDRNTIE